MKSIRPAALVIVTAILISLPGPLLGGSPKADKESIENDRVNALGESVSALQKDLNRVRAQTENHIRNHGTPETSDRDSTSLEASKYSLAKDINASFTSHIIGMTGIILAILFGVLGLVGVGGFFLLKNRLENKVDEATEGVTDRILDKAEVRINAARKVAQVRIYHQLSFQYYEQYFALAKSLKSYKKDSDSFRLASDEFERNLEMSIRLSEQATDIARTLESEKDLHWTYIAESTYAYHLSWAMLSSESQVLENDKQKLALKMANRAYSRCRDPKHADYYKNTWHNYADTYGWVLIVCGDDFDRPMAEQLLRSLVDNESLDEGWRKDRKKAYAEYLGLDFDLTESGGTPTPKSSK